MRRMVGALLACGVLGLGAAAAEEIGEVSTVFHFLSPDHKIVVEAFDDPKIAGVTCYLSRADAGGFKSMIGVEEDPSDASIACRQVGPIKVQDELEEGEEVFKQRTSLIFKSMQVVRFFDAEAQGVRLPGLFGSGDRGQPEELDLGGAGHGLGRRGAGPAADDE